MAYIVNTTQAAAATTGATYPITLPAVYADNDLLLVMLSNDSGGTDITTASAGWTMLGTSAQSGNQRSRWAYKIASGTESAPTFSGSNAGWIATTLVVRDVDTTTPFDVTPYRRDWNNVNSDTIPSSAITTVTAGSLLIYSHSADNNILMKYLISDCVCIDKYVVATNTQIIGYKQQQAAGISPAVKMYHAVATEGGNGWLIAIRNKSGGRLMPDLRTTYSIVQHFGTFATQHDNSTSGAPNTFATAINGIDCSTAAITPAVNAVFNTWGLGSSYSSAESIAAPGKWVGGVYTLGATVNLTGTVLNVEWAMSTTPSAAVGNEGVLLALSNADGSKWVAYQLASRAKSWVAAKVYSSFIAIGVDAATLYDSDGTIDAAFFETIAKVGLFYHRTGSTASTLILSFRTLGYYTSASITGGSIPYPTTPVDYVNAMLSWDGVETVKLQGSGQCLTMIPVQVGDGTNKTCYDAFGTSVEFPQAYSLTSVPNWQQTWNVLPSKVSLGVYGSSADSIALSAGVVATETFQPFTINASSDTGATYNFVGAPIVGFAPTWKTGIDCIGATFAECSTVNFKGADVTDTTIKNPVGAVPAVNFDESGATVTNTSIVLPTGTSATYHMELGTAVTAITLASVTFTGTPATNKVHVLKTTGTVTITVTDLVTNLVEADVTSEGATVVISAPANYQTVTITGGVAGTRIQVYDITSSTELYNDTPTFPYTWTDPSVAVGDREIRLRASWVDGVDAKLFVDQTIGTCTTSVPDIAYLLSQVDDQVYIDNAVDGSSVTGITFTDSAVDKMNMDLTTGELASMYAAWVWYAFSETGIASDIDYIDAIDQANYVYSNLIWKNVTDPSVPLKITGGYAWDAVTKDPLDLLDTTGGSIFLAPPHVVSTVITVAGGDVVTGTAAEIIAAMPNGTQSGLTAQGYTATRATYIDAPISTSGGGATLAQIEASTVLAKEATVAAKPTAAEVTTAVWSYTA